MVKRARCHGETLKSPRVREHRERQTLEDILIEFAGIDELHV